LTALVASFELSPFLEVTVSGGTSNIILLTGMHQYTARSFERTALSWHCGGWILVQPFLMPAPVVSATWLHEPVSVVAPIHRLCLHQIQIPQTHLLNLSTLGHQDQPQIQGSVLWRF
jgi:hypothetical protein